MWKLTIVLCATAAFFHSMAIGLPTEDDPSTFTTELQQQEGLLVVFVNRTLEKVNNRYTEVYREILNRGALDSKIEEAITLKYITKLGVNLEIMKPMIDDLISWGQDHGNFDETECRSFYESYIKAASDGINKVTKNAPSQAFRKVFLEFAEMLVQVKANLQELREKVLSGSEITVQEIAEVSASYYANFNSRTKQFLIQHERLFNGTAIEEIVRQDFDAMIDAAPGVIEMTHECISLSWRPDLSKVPIV